MVDNWTLRKRPARLERRIDFDSYDLTREFLDLTAEISEREGFYPDMNFGPMHVSMTIHTEDEEGILQDPQLRFARAVSRVVSTNKVQAPISAEYVWGDE